MVQGGPKKGGSVHITTPGMIITMVNENRIYRRWIDGIDRKWYDRVDRIYTFCILAAHSCMQFLTIFFLQAKKYQQIRVWKTMGHRLFYLNVINLNIFNHEILKSDINSYIQVNITNLKYHGWNVFKCLYGGMSFFELIYFTIYETLTLCDNYTNLESINYYHQKKTFVKNGNLKAEYLEQDSSNYIISYLSHRTEVILVLYHNSRFILHVSIQLFPSL